MSRYAVLDSEVIEQVASNRGWGDFIRWAGKLSGDYPDLKHLAAHGWDEDLGLVVKQLKSALSANPPDDDTRKVADDLLVLLQDRGDATVLTIT